MNTSEQLAYTKIAVVGDVYFIPSKWLEPFLQRYSGAEVLDEYSPQRIAREGLRILTPDDIELLSDAGAVWSEGMWTADAMRRAGLVVLVDSEGNPAHESNKSPRKKYLVGRKGVARRGFLW